MSIEEDLKIAQKIPLKKKTLINLVYTSCAVHNYLSVVIKPFNISLEQYNVLRILRGHKGVSLSLSEIQDRMVTKMSNTSRLVTKLKEKNLVIRIVNKNNRRKISISITKAGLSLLKKIDAIVDKAEEKLSSNLEIKDMNLLNESFEKIKMNCQ